MCFGITDEVSVFVICKNELGTRMCEDVIDLMLGQARVNRCYDRTRADDPL